MAANVRIIEDTFSGGLEVVSFTVTAGGSGYTSAPTVAVAAPPSGGGQATATATITGDAVTAVTIVNPGNSYVVAPAVTFSGGGGTSAAATAVMSTGDPTLYSGEACALIDFSNHGAAVTIDASAQLGGSNGSVIPVKLDISPLRAFAYSPFASRSSQTSREVETCTIIAFSGRISIIFRRTSS